MESYSKKRQSRLSDFFNLEDKDNDDNNSSDEQSSSNQSEDSQDQANYLTTNMLNQRNITIADVIVESVSQTDMISLFNKTCDEISEFESDGFIIDPKEIYREIAKKGSKQSVLNDSQIRTLGQLVLKLYTYYKLSDLEPQSLFDQAENFDLNMLEAKVIENHKVKDQITVFGQHTQLNTTVPRRVLKQLGKEKKQQEKELKIAEESLRLRDHEKLSYQQIMDRLGISYYKLRRYLKSPIKKAQFWNLKQINRGKYKKLHSRARTHIVNMLMFDTQPVQVSDIQRSLQKNIQLRCSQQMIRHFLKNELMMTYKQIKQISTLHNSNSSKLQRQYAAQQFVENLSEMNQLLTKQIRGTEVGLPLTLKIELQIHRDSNK